MNDLKQLELLERTNGTIRSYDSVLEFLFMKHGKFRKGTVLLFSRGITFSMGQFACAVLMTANHH